MLLLLCLLGRPEPPPVTSNAVAPLSSISSFPLLRRARTIRCERRKGTGEEELSLQMIQEVAGY